MAARIEGLLGRHVIHGADNAADLRQDAFVRRGGRTFNTSQARVGHLEHAAGVPHQVGWLDVAMDQALGVGILQAAGGLQGAMRGRRPGSAAPLLSPRRPNRGPDKLHRQKRAGVRFAGVEGHDDVDVAELGQRLHLPLETLGEGAVLGHLGRQDLDGRQALHASVPRFIDRAHGAFAEQVQHLIGTDPQVREAALQDGAGLV